VIVPATACQLKKIFQPLDFIGHDQRCPIVAQASGFLIAFSFALPIRHLR